MNEPNCSYCRMPDRPAVARVRWTVYGGAYKYAFVCDYHRRVAVGQRGLDIWPLCPSCWRPMADATGDWQCHRCQRLWPASYVTEMLYAASAPGAPPQEAR